MNFDSDTLFCIVSMDGGAPEGGGYVTSSVLAHTWWNIQCRAQRHETGPGHSHDHAREVVPFLSPPEQGPKRKLIFAGTSSGAWSALYMAKQKNPDDVLRHERPALSKLTQFWIGAIEAMSPKNSSVPKLLGALAGQTSLSGNERLLEYFKNEFGNDTLGSLHHNVVVTSFQLDSQEPWRRAQPKIFRNFGPNPDNDELIVDVALRTAAAPVVLPIYRAQNGLGPCYLDGGLFANNPAMCALSDVIAECRRIVKQEHITEVADVLAKKSVADMEVFISEVRKKMNTPQAEELVNRIIAATMQPQTSLSGLSQPVERLVRRLGNIRLLSVGNGFSTNYVEPSEHGESLDWGYQKWMFDLKSPGRLMNLVFTAGGDEIDRQCENMLGALSEFAQYKRLQPYVPSTLEALDGEAVREVIVRLRADPWLDDQIQKTIDWLATCGWVKVAVVGCQPPATDLRPG
jgi:Patatin-like phospholipase